MHLQVKTSLPPIDILETPDGPPIDLDTICECVQVQPKEGEWHVLTLLKKTLEEFKAKSGKEGNNEQHVELDDLDEFEESQ